MTTAKKLGLSALLVLLPAVEAAAARLSFRAGASYFLPSDKVFRDINAGRGTGRATGPSSPCPSAGVGKPGSRPAFSRKRAG